MGKMRILISLGDLTVVRDEKGTGAGDADACLSGRQSGSPRSTPPARGHIRRVARDPVPEDRSPRSASRGDSDGAASGNLVPLPGDQRTRRRCDVVGR